MVADSEKGKDRLKSNSRPLVGRADLELSSKYPVITIFPRELIQLVRRESYDGHDLAWGLSSFTGSAEVEHFTSELCYQATLRGRWVEIDRDEYQLRVFEHDSYDFNRYLDRSVELGRFTQRQSGSKRWVKFSEEFLGEVKERFQNPKTVQTIRRGHAFSG